ARLAKVATALPSASPEEAATARQELAAAKEQLAGAESQCILAQCAPPGSPRPIRIFIDGVFDLTHYGHMNAFRQARALGEYLVVGVNSDESVQKAKGFRPVLTDDERQAAVAACRFVDEIVPASPYIMTEAYIQDLVENRGIDYFVHGDDPCIVDGRDVYESARKAGRFCTIPRTEGISTTDIVGRLLLLTQDHHTELVTAAPSSGGRPSAVFASQQSNFLVTSQLLRAFSGALPGHFKPGKVVYVDGAWDMFHAGHVSLLGRARALGDLLIVGVHSDAVVNQHRGSNYPIMNMQERVLSVLGCRYVDDVLLDAPWTVTREMIATLRVSVVARGTICDTAERQEMEDPHAVPKSLGIHVELLSEETLSLASISERLKARGSEASKRQQTKANQERQWYREKHGLDAGPTH
ncbi:PECT1, partial [Symbiodinium microadriaticum]